jgi:hypothetical protein
MQQQNFGSLFGISSHLHVAIRHANPSALRHVPQAQLSLLLIPQFAGNFFFKKKKRLYFVATMVQRVKIFQAPKLLAFVAYETEQSADKVGVACSWFIFLSPKICNRQSS